jgi:hypothetical protein
LASFFANVSIEEMSPDSGLLAIFCSSMNSDRRVLRSLFSSVSFSIVPDSDVGVGVDNSSKSNNRRCLARRENLVNGNLTMIDSLMMEASL